MTDFLEIKKMCSCYLKAFLSTGIVLADEILHLRLIALYTFTMPVMYSFCFWFSVRLGAIIVGAICLLQAIVALVLCYLAMKDPQGLSEMAQEFRDSYDMMFMTDAVTSLEEDPSGCLNALLAGLIVYAIACILLIYGAFKCNVYMIYPFLAYDLARLIVTSVSFVLAMIIIKQNTVDLGLIILYSISGGFVLLFLFYLWFCTVSLCQTINELKRQGTLLTPLVEEDAPPSPRKYRGMYRLDDYNYHYPMTLGRPIY